MTRTLAALLIVSAAPGFADEAKDKAVKDDLAKLEGTWKVVAAEAAGNKLEGKDAGPDMIVITGKKLTFRADGKEIFAVDEVTLDPTKKPKQMDWVKQKGQLPCIYALDGDELKVAMPLVPAERKDGETIARPDGFDSKGKAFLVLTAKREKPKP